MSESDLGSRPRGKTNAHAVVQITTASVVIAGHSRNPHYSRNGDIRRPQIDQQGGKGSRKMKVVDMDASGTASTPLNAGDDRGRVGRVEGVCKPSQMVQVLPRPPPCLAEAYAEAPSRADGWADCVRTCAMIACCCSMVDRGCAQAHAARLVRMSWVRPKLES